MRVGRRTMLLQVTQFPRHQPISRKPTQFHENLSKCTNLDATHQFEPNGHAEQSGIWMQNENKQGGTAWRKRLGQRRRRRRAAPTAKRKRALRTGGVAILGAVSAWRAACAQHLHGSFELPKCSLSSVMISSYAIYVHTSPKYVLLY